MSVKSFSCLDVLSCGAGLFGVLFTFTSMARTVNPLFVFKHLSLAMLRHSVTCSLTASGAHRAAVRNDAWLRKWVTKAGCCLPAVLNNILSLPVTGCFSCTLIWVNRTSYRLISSFDLYVEWGLNTYFASLQCRPLYGLQEGCAWFSFF